MMKVAVVKGKIVRMDKIFQFDPSNVRVVEIKGKHMDYDLKHFIVQNGKVVDVRGDFDAKP